MELPLKKADILLPKNTDMKKWSVVACDQYTSEPAYWRAVEAEVANNPSTLNLILPEVFLNESDVDDRIKNINKNAKKLLDDGFFKEYKNTLFYVEREQSDGNIREGIIGMVDLEAYDYNVGSTSLIRATEKTIIERIPPRVKIRENASLELPHIMILIDDEEKVIIESIKNHVAEDQLVYDFDLMQHGGHIRGYVLNDYSDVVLNNLNKLVDKEYFNNKYGLNNESVLAFAMGDGNHSLATAKVCYENLKKVTSKDEYLSSPLRYALVEVVNLHSQAIKFEAIHRVLFGVDVVNLMTKLEKYYDISYEESDGQRIEVVTKDYDKFFWINNPKSNIAVGSLQMFLDDYLKHNSGKIDYIHGENVTRKLAREDGNIGFLLPVMGKTDLFKTIILDGVLPRKTFSMGHSNDKRYYLEARKLV